MAASNLDVIKDVPGYKVILKAVLKTQIQQLVEQLAVHTDEESVILTASVADGTLSHLGSDSGKSFLDDHEDVKSQFLGFCLKKHHRKKAEEKEKEREKQLEQERFQTATQLAMPGIPGPRRGGPMGRAMFPRHSTPRHSPYSMPPRPVFDRHPSGDFSQMSQEDPLQQQQQMGGPQMNIIKHENTEGQGLTMGESSDNERSNSSSSTLPVDNSGANINMGGGGDDSEGISVKTEVGDSELDLEITGVELGMPGSGQDDWSRTNTSMGMSFDPNAATGSQADMSAAGQQGYNAVNATLLEVAKPCPYCQKMFQSNWKLETHMRIHTGEKPFKCVQCGKAFNVKGNLKTHMARHLLDAPQNMGITQL